VAWLGDLLAAGGRRYHRLFTDISKLETLGCCLVRKQRQGAHVSAKEVPGSWNAAGLSRRCIRSRGSVAATYHNFLEMLLKLRRDFGHVSPC